MQNKIFQKMNILFSDYHMWFIHHHLQNYIKKKKWHNIFKYICFYNMLINSHFQRIQNKILNFHNRYLISNFWKQHPIFIYLLFGAHILSAIYLRGRSKDFITFAFGKKLWTCPKIEIHLWKEGGPKVMVCWCGKR